MIRHLLFLLYSNSIRAWLRYFFHFMINGPDNRYFFVLDFFWASIDLNMSLHFFEWGSLWYFVVDFIVFFSFICSFFQEIYFLNLFNRKTFAYFLLFYYFKLFYKFFKFDFSIYKVVRKFIYCFYKFEEIRLSIYNYLN
jgi:hypothetical protein